MRFVTLVLAMLALPALAGPPRVENVQVTRTGSTWKFAVTVSHADEGWDHYADAWRVLDMDGNVLGIRELLHPHVEEQPFTRSLSSVRIPEGTERVQIQTRDSVTGWNPKTTIVRLP
ncbi:hypothetical protein R5H30_13345 [Sulfitobacter sp. D35]|uniref:hypothetical protein n=1 Tax=Sulfitobacter sp. D35 TaxID=3083252 RepID=UPI00296E93A4|nr:hypothetical protein [Sulfitobacter sp. D35]MDW4498974.1 hypothetical protein [Sulfitobacter sp. D35]